MARERVRVGGIIHGLIGALALVLSHGTARADDAGATPKSRTSPAADAAIHELLTGSSGSAFGGLSYAGPVDPPRTVNARASGPSAEATQSLERAVAAREGDLEKCVEQFVPAKVSGMVTVRARIGRVFLNGITATPSKSLERYERLPRCITTVLTDVHVPGDLDSAVEIAIGIRTFPHMGALGLASGVGGLGSGYGVSGRGAGGLGSVGAGGLGSIGTRGAGRNAARPASSATRGPRSYATVFVHGSSKTERTAENVLRVWLRSEGCVRDAAPGQRLVLHIDLEPVGTVKDVRVVRGNSPAAEQKCIASAIRRIQFVSSGTRSRRHG